MPLKWLQASLVAGAVALAQPAAAADEPAKAGGLVMLDYQTIKIDGYPSIDLVGFHFLNRFTDWLYVGVGGHAPLVKGEYGGFMAFDATVHVERRLFGNVSAMAGASLGGGGGGKSVEQSKIISGSGGFGKAYLGLGYRLKDLSVGLQVSRIRFTNSAINGSQVGVFLQAPFSYSVAPYESAGLKFPSPPRDAATAEKGVVVLGFDNLVQIDPKGSYTKTVNLVDAQYNHFLADNYYLLFGGSVGYHGIVAYNQVYGGVGYRYSPAPRFNLHLQLAIGSGGYAPERIDTGSGLLVHPKLSAEYLLNDRFGIQVSGGYLYAPRGSSKNGTVGLALAYHTSPVAGMASSGSASDAAFSGHRIHLFQQTETNVKVGDNRPGNIRMWSGQVDTVIGDNLYIPVQGSIAYNAYFGYPGYGELLAGIGLQSRFARNDSLQTFAQLLVGTNVHGVIVKPSVGLNYGLSDRLAVYAQLGGALSLDGSGLYPKEKKFRATSVGLGLSYRFSLPG